MGAASPPNLNLPSTAVRAEAPSQIDHSSVSPDGTFSLFLNCDDESLQLSRFIWISTPGERLERRRDGPDRDSGGGVGGELAGKLAGWCRQDGGCKQEEELALQLEEGGRTRLNC